jgi:dihydrofolate reductase
MKNILVAYDKNYGIGAANDLLWQRDLPADLRRFKELTTGNAIIMGRKTFDSIGRPLPNRQNIVISRHPLKIEGITVVDSLEKAYQAVDRDKETFVLGGGEIYRLALDSVDRIYATEVQETFTADVFFPALDKTIWRETSRVHYAADEKNKYDFDFVIYEHA